MAYSMEAVSRARQRLAEAKADRESENRARLLAAYEKVPRLRQIDTLLRQTMVLAAQAVFAGGDAETTMAQAREKNQALQQEREALAAAHFPAGYLSENPVCALCGGTGYVGSRMCRCLAALCREEQQKALGEPAASCPGFAGFRLDYYSDLADGRYGASPRAIMERNFRACRDYAGHFTENAGNLLFVGGTGLGKTFLASCIAREAAGAGYSVAYETAISLFSLLEKAKFTSSEEARRAAERIGEAQLLVIDDLGTEMPGQFVTAALYGLLDDRLTGKKPMVITTNLTVEEAGKRYSPQIASRLYGEFSRLTFVGSDIRALKNRGL